MSSELQVVGKSVTKTRKEQPELQQLGKLPPQAVDLEQAVLGAALLEKDALSLVIGTLQPEHFYKESHKAIYKAIVALYNESAPVDILTVTNKLRSTNEVELAGGPYYITTLTNKVASAAHMEYHARVVMECAMKRELIRLLHQAQRDAFEDDSDIFQLLDTTEQSIFNLSHIGVQKKVQTAKSVLADAFTELQERQNKSGEVTGVPSGFNTLDQITGGWQCTDLIIIAARPSMGKTAFVLTVIRAASIIHNIPSAVFSLEMSAVQLMNRLISGEAKVNSMDIKNGTVAEHEIATIHQKTAPLAKSPIYIDDTPGLTVLELRAKCRRLKAMHDIQLIVIDYLQLMRGDKSNQYRGGNREQEIAGISRALKILAKELNVPVIVLSQLSRAVETRGGEKKPQLSDLRESGSIEQDADLVSFLYRPAYYGITSDLHGLPLPDGYTELIIRKHRNGTLEKVGLQFIPKYVEFLDLR